MSSCEPRHMNSWWEFSAQQDWELLGDRSHLLQTRTDPAQLSTVSQSWMDKLRRSFRSSFRRKDSPEEDVGGAGQGQARQWPADEAAVKSNNCSFEVKYLGSLEVGRQRFACLISVLANISGVRVPRNAGVWRGSEKFEKFQAETDQGKPPHIRGRTESVGPGD